MLGSDAQLRVGGLLPDRVLAQATPEALGVGAEVAEARRILAGQIVMQPLAQARPQVTGVVLHQRAVDELALPAIDPGAEIRVFFQLHQQAFGLGGIALAQRMPGIVQDELHFIDHRVGELLRQRLAQRIGVVQLVGQPGQLGELPSRHRHHSLGDEAAHFGFVQPAGDLRQSRIEQVLVMLPGGQCTGQAGGSAGGIPGQQLAMDQAQHLAFDQRGVE